MTERTYDRLDLAKGQLDTALNLLLDHEDYPSAITLAGAAEEMFGRALTNRGGKSALDHSYDSMSDLYRTLCDEKVDKRKFVAQENAARNALKHLQASEGTTIALDLKTAASWMLARAILNGHALQLEFHRYQEFDSWFHEHIVGRQA